MEDRSRPTSFFSDLRSRELNGLRVRKRPHLEDLTSDAGGPGAGVLAIEHDGEPSPPTAVSFCKSSRNPHLLAVSDEEGYVNFYDTRRSLPSYSSCWEGAGQARVCNWVAHSNAIFDICWNKEDNQILTASGDQHIKIWNAEKITCTGSLAGHTGSVKAVCSHSSNPDLVVSGSRDGSFALWDLRCSFSSTNRFGETCLSPISLVNDAHALTRRKRGRQGKADSKSITSVLYLKDGITIATAGAVNSVVKFWDTRNLKTSIVQACPAADRSTKSARIQHGITSLSQDSYGVSLAASCRDNRIYLYDVLKIERGPMKFFSGSKIGSFFVKSTISPDGDHILGGSSDYNAYIWQVRRPESAPTILKGHQGEVTSVDWCSSDLGKVATSSDDFMVRVWKMNKDGCLNTKSPAAIRKRIIAPSVEPRRLILDEPPTCSVSMEDNFQAMEATVHEPSSPAQCKIVEFRTPESGRKRGSSFLMDGKEMQQSLEASSGSPSSVLSPPPSTKRRTILDYYHSV